MKVTTATRTIEELCTIFKCWGSPEQITNNEPQFTSEEFKKFMHSNGIKHSRTAPYHPQSNGAVEQFVQSFKQAMKKMIWQKGDINKKLADFLLRYRKTPHTTTDEAPAMLLMKRIPRSRIDLCHPNLKNTVENKQEAQKRNHDVHAKQKKFDTQTKYGLEIIEEVKSGVQGS